MLNGSQEEHAREIARQEVRSFARLLADEIASTPMRADGNLNARDFYQSLHTAIERYERGEVA
jgi:hypothetical protein